ncbi:MAG: succinate dehydrogenase/fumarate reductase iron-sulfur subunit [Alkalispirochaeta sp.]
MSNATHDPTAMIEPALRTVVFRIERKQLDEGWSEYEVPIKGHTTVVDALEWIKNHLDDTLLFRHSCHHGSCGTCGMVINGERKLACTTNVKELVEAAEADGRDTTVEVLPLQTMTHIGDLAVDPTPLFKDFPVAATYLRASEANKNSQTPDEIDRYVRFENCIECGLCVSACPVISIRKFMGPAGLSAYNLELDKNPHRSAELLPEVDTDEGVWGCDRHLACSAVCPTGVYPGKQIAMLQRKIKKARGE